jgi:molecular chaperone GrpE
MNSAVRNGASDDMTSEQLPDDSGGDNSDRVEPAEEVDLISSLQRELDQTTDQVKRQAAEFQNYRRRTESEKQQMVSFGKSIVLQQLLDVFDDLQRSVTAATEAHLGTVEDVERAFDSLRTGVELANQKLMDELTKLNVEVIESIGHPFDEEFHEAVMQQPAGDGDDAGIVLAEVQRGFKLGDRVLRHAKVIVSS